MQNLRVNDRCKMHKYKQQLLIQVEIKSDGEYFLHFDLAELYSHVSIDVRWQLA